MDEHKIYIAGPMTGYKDWNYPAFRHAAARMRALCWDVVSPVEVAEPFGTPERLCEDPALMQAAVQAELHALEDCSHILLLPGWERSQGARVELVHAITYSLEIIVATPELLPGLPAYVKERTTHGRQ